MDVGATTADVRASRGPVLAHKKCLWHKAQGQLG